MTKDHEKHLAQIGHRFHVEYDAKYRNGQREHGSNLWELGALFFAQASREEALDQVSYTDCLKLDLLHMHVIVKAALAPNVPDSVLRDYLGQIRALLEGKAATPGAVIGDENAGG